MLDGIADRTREGCAARGPAAPLGVFRSLTLPFTVGGHSSGLPGVKLYSFVARRGCRPILRMPVPALRIPKQQHTTRAPGLSAPDHEDDLSFPATRCSCPTAVSHGLLHGSGAAASPRVSGLRSQQTALRAASPPPARTTRSWAAPYRRNRRSGRHPLNAFRCTGEDCIKRRLSFRTLSPETNSSYGRRGSRLFTKSFLTKRLLCVPPVTPCRGFDRRAGHSRPWISLPWPAALSGQVFPTIAGQSALGSRLPVASGTGDVAAGAGSLPATGLRGAVQTKGDDGGPAARSGGVGPAEFCGPHPPALVSNGTPRGVPDAGSRERSGGAAPPRSRAPPRPRPR